MTERRHLTRDDVIEAYRLFFGRDPESEDIIEHHCGAHTVLDLHRRILRSPEYRRRAIDSLSADYNLNYDPRTIDASASESQIREILERSETYWRSIGESEPYWSVLTADIFKMDNIEPATIESFYQSGTFELSEAVRALERNGVNYSGAWTVLDLGCGLGRMCENFLSIFSGYIGVDISRSHLKIAKARAQQKGAGNRATFFQLLDYVSSPRQFDFFFSVIALQHNSPPMMCWLLDKFLSSVKKGGVALFQIPCHLYDYTFNTIEYLRSPTSLTDMEMHALPQSHVISVLSRNGFRLLEVLPYPRIGAIGYSFSFLAIKD